GWGTGLKFRFRARRIVRISNRPPVSRRTTANSFDAVPGLRAVRSNLFLTVSPSIFFTSIYRHSAGTVTRIRGTPLFRRGWISASNYFLRFDPVRIKKGFSPEERSLAAENISERPAGSPGGDPERLFAVQLDRVSDGGRTRLMAGQVGLPLGVFLVLEIVHHAQRKLA